MMRSAARLNPDHSRRKFLEECDHLFAPQLPAKNRLVGRIYAVQLKNMFRRIHANSNNLLHDCLLSDVSTTHSDWPKPPGPSTPTRNQADRHRFLANAMTRRSTETPQKSGESGFFTDDSAGHHRCQRPGHAGKSEQVADEKSKRNLKRVASDSPRSDSLDSLQQSLILNSRHTDLNQNMTGSV